MSKKTKQPSFEEAIELLEEITRQLERGDLSLEDSIAAYEKGMQLSKSCKQMLDRAERKLEYLAQQEDGSLVKKPIEPAEEQGESHNQSRLFQ